MLPARTPAQGSTGSAQQSRGCLLIADDDSEFRASVAASLQSHGFRVLHASTGDEALDVLTDNAVDVLIADLVMPGLSGFELLRVARRRSLRRSLRLIAFTDKRAIDTALSDMVRSLGAEAVLVKSLDVEPLLGVIAGRT